MDAFFVQRGNIPNFEVFGEEFRDVMPDSPLTAEDLELINDLLGFDSQSELNIQNQLVFPSLHDEVSKHSQLGFASSEASPLSPLPEITWSPSSSTGLKSEASTFLQVAITSEDFDDEVIMLPRDQNSQNGSESSSEPRQVATPQDGGTSAQGLTLVLTGSAGLQPTWVLSHVQTSAIDGVRNVHNKTQENLPSSATENQIQQKLPSATESQIQQTLPSSATESQIQQTLPSSVVESQIQQTLLSSVVASQIQQTLLSSVVESQIQQTLPSSATESQILQTLPSSVVESQIQQNLPSSAVESQIQQTLPSSAVESQIQQTLPSSVAESQIQQTLPSSVVESQIQQNLSWTPVETIIQDQSCGQVEAPHPRAESKSHPKPFVQLTNTEICKVKGKRRGRKPGLHRKKRWESKSHKDAEVRRRQKIQDCVKELYLRVPSLKSSRRRTSELKAVTHAVKHLKELTLQRERKRTEYSHVLDEKRALMRDIEEFQHQLPHRGLRGEDNSSLSIHERYAQHVKNRSQQNWRYWLFHCIIRHLLADYEAEVTTTSVQQFHASLRKWIDSSLGLPTFRPAVIEAQVEIARQTSFMTQPALVPDEIRAILAGSSQSVT